MSMAGLELTAHLLCDDAIELCATRMARVLNVSLIFVGKAAWGVYTWPLVSCAIKHRGATSSNHQSTAPQPTQDPAAGPVARSASRPITLHGSAPSLPQCLRVSV